MLVETEFVTVLDAWSDDKELNGVNFDLDSVAQPSSGWTQTESPFISCTSVRETGFDWDIITCDLVSVPVMRHFTTSDVD